MPGRLWPWKEWAIRPGSGSPQHGAAAATTTLSISLGLRGEGHAVVLATRTTTASPILRRSYGYKTVDQLRDSLPT